MKIRARHLAKATERMQGEGIDADASFALKFFDDMCGEKFSRIYGPWIIAQYATGNILCLDTVGRDVLPTIVEFHDLKCRQKIEVSKRDIYSIKTMNELCALVLKNRHKLSRREAKAGEERAFFMDCKATLLYEDQDIQVVIPRTQDASCFFGRNTRWCTAATQIKNDFFKYSDGPLYIVLFKKANKRYQFHLQRLQFCDELDIDINPFELADMHPVLSRLIRDYDW